MSVKRIFIGMVTAVMLAYGSLAYGAGDLHMRLEPVKFDIKNVASVKRGAKYFATQCMVCHSMKYLDHNKIAQEAGILKEKMPAKDQTWWFGAAPPDLSLIARSRSPQWIYTYLHAFYLDDTTKLGSNNLLVPHSNMPNPFGGLQGEQVLVLPLDRLHEAHSVFAPRPRYFSLLRLDKPGSLKPEAFHQQIHDMVNFLVYASDPAKLERENLGWWVLAFLLILIGLTYLLKKEYWRDIK